MMNWMTRFLLLILLAMSGSVVTLEQPPVMAGPTTVDSVPAVIWLCSPCRATSRRWVR